MPAYYTDIIQGTDEWHTLRLGVITASNINKLITPKGKPAKNQSMRDYACHVAAQRILMCVEESFQSFDMLRGHIQEDIARDIYRNNFSPVDECGFVTNLIEGVLVGCSPDGLVGDDGGIEIKSRLAKFQIATIISGETPDEYQNQIQTFLMVTERDWCDFVQYSNGMPLFVKRVLPDPVRQAEIIVALIEFEAQVKTTVVEYEAKSRGMVETERVDFMADDMMTGSEEA